MPELLRPRRVIGRNLQFRHVTSGDAAFILSLRLDPAKNAHLSPTNPDVAQQVAWLERYEASSGQVYFIIEDRAGTPAGTVRLYDARGTSFCWGSWILRHAMPPTSAVESALLVYDFAFRNLGFTSSHFDVRKANEKVCRFHERFGAVRTGETELDWLYEYSASAYDGIRQRYEQLLPGSANVQW